MDPLSQLKDIHLPPPISWWPPAYGWFLLAALICIGIFLIIRFFHLKTQRNQLRRSALAKLKDLAQTQSDPKEKLAALSRLLKTIVKTQFPKEPCHLLYGQRWLQFLDRTSDTTEFTKGVGKVLASGPYKEHVPYESTPLIDLVQRWIEKNTPC